MAKTSKSFKNGRRKTGGRKAGTKNKATREIQEFSRSLLESPTYVKSLKARLIAGESPHMEKLLFHYGYGVPQHPVDIEVGERFEASLSKSAEEFTDRLAIMAQRMQARS